MELHFTKIPTPKITFYSKKNLNDNHDDYQNSTHRAERVKRVECVPLYYLDMVSNLKVKMSSGKDQEVPKIQKRDSTKVLLGTP